MERSDFRDLFVSEANDYVGSLNQATLRLEKNRQDLEAVHTLFRAAHTLKGMAATMGFEGITRLTHDFESVLDQVRSGSQQLGQPIIDLLFDGIDELTRQVENVASGGDGGEAPAGMLDRLQKAMKGELQEGRQGKAAPALTLPPALAAKETAPVQAPQGDFPGYPANEAMRSHVAARVAQGAAVSHLRVGIDPKCAFKGVRAFLVVKNLEKAGNILHTQPSTKELQDGQFELSFELWVESGLSGEDLKHICSKVMEVTTVELGRLSGDGAAGTPGPAPRTGSPAHTLSRGAMAAPPAFQAAEPEPAADAAPVAAAVAVASAKSTTIRVNVERLDRIMDMVGELVTSKIRLAQIAKERQVKDLSDALIQVEHIVNELQVETMAARMVPMEQVFSRFPRMIRDLARELGKEVELELEGGEIEVDRTILDEITDPLVHLLRNAVDHGIETPEARRQLGKPASGLLRLRARREKNQVLITVEDDGEGIRTDKVRAAAVRKGLMREEQARALTEEEAINLVALPGFSTASKVTAVSGRGVGVDAVRTKVEKLGGTLRIESQTGRGSQFKVRLPLTLAIIQALIVRVGREEYAAPVSNVVEAVEMSSSELRVIHGQEVVMLREEVLPVFRLGRLLEEPGQPNEVPPVFSVLVAEAGERRAGVLVDEVVGQTEIAIKNLGRFLKSIRGFGGVTILGDGRIVLILDFATLLDA